MDLNDVIDKDYQHIDTYTDNNFKKINNDENKTTKIQTNQDNQINQENQLRKEEFSLNNKNEYINFPFIEIPPNSIIIKEKVMKMNGELKIFNYLKGKFIGKGGFAKCYEFTNLETHHKSAVKIVEKSSLTKLRAKQKLISEIKIHKSIHNSHVVEFEHYFEDSENVYILLEMCQNQSLNELIKRRKRLSEFEVVYYVHQLIHALKYLHSHRIIHRDLKLGNLFIDEKMNLKVGDFGLAAKLEYEGERKRTVCGTPNYIAPEILEGKMGHSYEVDIWAIGVIIYTLIIGRPPFETNEVKYTYKKIKTNDYHFPENALISDSAKGLIKSILVNDPHMRPSLDQILSSDFITLGKNLPKYLPCSTLAIPPTITYIKQYWPDSDNNGNMKINNSHKHFNIINEEINLKVHKNEENVLIINNNSSDIIIEKWIDYSSKYGVGYILSNNSIGVYFNDASKIILDQNGKTFHYLEKRSADKIELMSTYTLDDYPKEILNKKVILLNHFKNYLLDDKNSNNNLPYNSDKEFHSHNNCSNNFVYLKKWMRTKQAILFRLSNKIVQVVFLDHTQIILSSETKQVMYVNKNNETEKFHLNNALESDNEDMVKRLKYTKDILTHMLNINKQSEIAKIQNKENLNNKINNINNMENKENINVNSNIIS